MKWPKQPPERGDHVQIVWADITGGGRDDPDEMELFKWEPHLGYYYGERISYGIPCVVLVTTMPTPENREVGTDIFPQPLILSLKVTKRVNRRKKKEAPSVDTTDQPAT